MVLQETFVLEDYYYYSPTEYTNPNNPTTLNVPLPNGPFTFEYDCIPSTRNSSVPYVTIGRGTNDRILVGQYARAGTNGIILYTGSQTNKPLPNVTVLNANNHFTFTYDGSNYKIDRDGENITVTGVGIHFDYILQVSEGWGGTIKNLKVKAL